VGHTVPRRGPDVARGPDVVHHWCKVRATVQVRIHWMVLHVSKRQPAATSSIWTSFICQRYTFYQESTRLTPLMLGWTVPLPDVSL